MKQNLLIALLCCISFTVAAQQNTSVHSDDYLFSLVKKHVQTPVHTTTLDNGDIMLQRDMTAYLRQSVLKEENIPASQLDGGHDHKSEMLIEFLNRPHPSVSTLNKYFSNAAQEFNVPVEILKAYAQVQSNWAQVSESIYGSWGVMGIIENPYVQQISAAATLLSVNADAIKTDANTNIRAAASLLNQYQTAERNNLEAWYPAVKKLTGLTDKAMAAMLAQQVFDVVKKGSKTVTLWGEIINIAPSSLQLSSEVLKESEPEVSNSVLAPDYPTAIENYTTCTSNYGTRPGGYTIKYYFIHYIATGTYAGAISWFKTCTSNVSAHYVVKNDNGQVTQVVKELDRAYSQGVSEYNNNGIGVEHEVLATNLLMWESEQMLSSAAALCIDVCNRNAIPKTRRINNGDPGIYGHSDVRATDCPNMTTDRWNNFLKRVAGVTIPATPTLYSILSNGSGDAVTATWKANTDANLVGYRLYYATDDNLANWALAANETTLLPAITSITLTPSQFVNVPSGNVYHFKITALVNDGVNGLQEGFASDVYSRSSNVAGSKVLIVDGFDRRTGSASYQAPTHSFTAKYFKALRDRGALQISSVADERVEDNTVNLEDYDIVVWYSGDESTADDPFLANQKTKIKTFLDNGGKLLLSGSEISYTYGRSASADYDLAFADNYLKSAYVTDGAVSYTPATGIAGTPFEGLTIPFGITYAEDFPDGINAKNGSINILNYSNGTNRAGVAYKGNFGAGSTPGAIIFLSFTLETAEDINVRKFMAKALAYFDETVLTSPPTAVNDAAATQTGFAKTINIIANDEDNETNINPATVTIVTPPANGSATVDANGNLTYTSNVAYTGSDVITYNVKNILNQTSNNATVTFTVSTATAACGSEFETDEQKPKRDLRGAWVGSVFNLDWPSSRTLSTAQQQNELLLMLDTLKSTGINVVYLQVRPEGDALYNSSIEPWSYWLTNAQGTAPSPAWDPLEFAITEAHKRGMELHAWLNPFRAKASGGTPTLAANHVSVLHPDWIFDPTAATTILNPGLPVVRDYITSVVRDIATRYNIDGIHFDDYFYPSGATTTQDQTTYANNNPANIATIQDWRRSNINSFIAQVYDTIQNINARENRGIMFGVSPFGIWKSGTPAGITGNSSYDAMFCDPIAWLQAGKVDYLAPQLYWKITGAQDYTALSKWWNDQGALYNRPVYPGLALYKLVDANNWAATEVTNQIDVNRSATHENIKGQVFYSAKHIATNAKTIKTALQTDEFKHNAIPPAATWKDNVCPNIPQAVYRDGDTLRWTMPATATDGDEAKRYVVYRFASVSEASANMQNSRKIYAVVYNSKAYVNATDNSATTDIGSYFAISALDDYNNESELSALVALPVRGLLLNAELKIENNVRVQWQTLTEVNTQKFEVERSSDGINYKHINTTEAAGYSQSPRNYFVNDMLPQKGVYYYRIKAIDKDGKYSYSNVDKVVYNLLKNEYVVAPNPAKYVVNIMNTANAESIELFDVWGRRVLSAKYSGQSTISINVSSLASGIYYLKIKNKDKQQKEIKVVKQ